MSDEHLKQYLRQLQSQVTMQAAQIQAATEIMALLHERLGGQKAADTLKLWQQRAALLELEMKDARQKPDPGGPN